jgi:hypothetical protein
MAFACLVYTVHDIRQYRRPLPPATRVSPSTGAAPEEIPGPDVPLSATVLGLPTNPADDTFVQRILRKRSRSYVGKHRPVSGRVGTLASDAQPAQP